MIGFLVLLCVLLLCILLATKTYKFFTTVNKIPTPAGAPLIGHLLPLLADPDGMFYKVREYSATYYPIYRLSAFFVTAVILLDPSDIEIVLSSSKHIQKTVVYGFLKKWLGTGLLTSQGDKWRKRRKILTPAFHFNILQQFVDVFNNETDHLVKKLEGEDSKPHFNVIPYITNFTLHSIGETAMGFSNVSESLLGRYKDAVYRIGKLMLTRMSKPWLHLRPIYKLTSLYQDEKVLVDILHRFTNTIIDRRQSEISEKNTSEKGSKKGPDGSYSHRKRLAMLDLLLKAKSDGEDLNYEGIREEVDTFMFEGHDTTAMAISFMLMTLANLEDIQTKIYQEIIEVLGPLKSPSFQDLQELRYTERCIKEMLRLFPSVPFIARFAAEDFETSAGYKIPKGTFIHIHIFDIHRSPHLYPDPLRFDPDRFLPEKCNERNPFAYIPFSAGPRNCIGQRFAMLELKAVLCGILRRFVLKKVDDMYDMKFRSDLVLRPQTDIKVKILPRLESTGQAV